MKLDGSLPSRRLARPPDLYLVVYIAALLGLAASPLCARGSENLLYSLAPALSPLSAAAICYVAGTRASDSRDRLSWHLLGLAFLAWTVGGVEVWPEARTWKVDVQDAAAVGAQSLWYGLAFIAFMLNGTGDQGRMARANWVIDSLLFAVTSAGLLWQLALAPAIQGAEPLQSSVRDVLWLVGELLLLNGLAAKLLARRPEAMDTKWLGLPIAFALFVILDCLRVVSSRGYLWSAAVPAALWALAPAPIGVAVLTQVLSREKEVWPLGDRVVGLTRAIQFCLRVCPVPAAGLLLYLGSQDVSALDWSGESEAATAGLILLALIAIRQGLTLLENTRLRLSLLNLSQELESRVRQRTDELVRKGEQLASLNRVATELSQCVDSKEALLTGLELACEATRALFGAVWLAKPEGGSELAVQKGDAALPPALLTDLPDKAPFLKQAFTAGNPVILHHPELASLAKAEIEGTREKQARSLLLVPLLSRRTVMGTMGLVVPSNANADDWEFLLSRAIGAELGVAVENFRRYEEVRELADRDSVTGLLNHRAIHVRLDQELRRAQRGGQQLSVLMIDLDGFKLFNDTYGHQTGDMVLRQVGQVLVESGRSSDVAGRYGGDEFVLILPDTTQEGARVVAERVRVGLASHPFRTPDGLSVPIRVSIGVATYPYDARQALQLMGAADSNLYESKQRGGDAITASGRWQGVEVMAVGQFSVLDGLVTAVDNKDHYTRRHSEDVTTYALSLAKALGLHEDWHRTLRIAALLHDVGKIGVPYRLLRKPGRLQRDEFEVLKQHVTLGEMMIKDVPNISEVLSAVGSHHERFDGRGYPRGLRAEEIPLLGRVLAVADAYSAMTTDRPYRKALNPQEASEELLHVAGSQLDPQLAKVFVKMVCDGSLGTGLPLRSESAGD